MAGRPAIVKKFDPRIVDPPKPQFSTTVETTTTTTVVQTSTGAGSKTCADRISLLGGEEWGQSTDFLLGGVVTERWNEQKVAMLYALSCSYG